MRDKVSTPYVEATLMEIQRMGDLVPFAVRKEFTLCFKQKISKLEINGVKELHKHDVG